MAVIKKKSPRAPSITLKDAIERAIRAYDRERLHEAPTEVVAQNIGYKNANSGTALSAIASLRYFGLLLRPRNGFLAVSKEVEAFRYAPTETQRQSLLVGFLMKPPLYQELLRKYDSGLPSDATLKYELIQRGFIPAAAETALSAFKESVAFANYFEESKKLAQSEEDDEEQQHADEEASSTQQSQSPVQVGNTLAPTEPVAEEHDRIPVRLSGGRRAWLIIPSPLYKADRDRLKAHIDLLLAEDDED
jgi:hypothetical protein